MTNAQIIFEESRRLLNDGIIGSTGRKIKISYEKDGEQVEEIIDEPEEIHTFADWKSRGYFVKKGEKAKAKFMIWNFTSKPGKATKEARKAAGKDEEEPDPHYYMKEAYFFTKNQVSAIA